MSRFFLGYPIDAALRDLLQKVTPYQRHLLSQGFLEELKLERAYLGKHGEGERGEEVLNFHKHVESILRSFFPHYLFYKERYLFTPHE